MLKKLIDKPIKILNLKWLSFEWTLDTLGSNKNKDKLMANIIRIWSIFGLMLVAVENFGFLEIIVFTLSIIFIGVTDVRWYRNDGKLEIKTW